MADRPATEPTEEIEVTPEMIEAGLWHLMRVDTTASTDAEFVEILSDIYRT